MLVKRKEGPMFGRKFLIIRSSINMLLEDDVKTLMEFYKTKNALLVNVFSTN